MGLLPRLGRRSPKQKVVVFSNYVNATVRKRCAQLGVDAVFDKSTEIDALVDYCARQCALQAASVHPSGA
jgi:DNA-binding NarL/FixJ family response regulator